MSPQLQGLRHLYLKTENLQNVAKFLERTQMYGIFFSSFFSLHLYLILCLLQLSRRGKKKNQTTTPEFAHIII